MTLFVAARDQFLVFVEKTYKYIMLGMALSVLAYVVAVVALGETVPINYGQLLLWPLVLPVIIMTYLFLVAVADLHNSPPSLLDNEVTLERWYPPRMVYIGCVMAGVLSFICLMVSIVLVFTYPEVPVPNPYATSGTASQYRFAIWWLPLLLALMFFGLAASEQQYWGRISWDITTSRLISRRDFSPWFFWRGQEFEDIQWWQVADVYNVQNPSIARKKAKKGSEQADQLPVENHYRGENLALLLSNFGCGLVIVKFRLHDAADTTSVLAFYPVPDFNVFADKLRTHAPSLMKRNITER